MRHRMYTALLWIGLGSANALTPLHDKSPGFFAGEWTGSGEHGSTCYVKLGADGLGWVLIDGGSGDWMGAKMQWHNRKQTLQLDKITPLGASPRLRTLPLQKFVLASGFNRSLKLTWNEGSASCQMQHLERAERHLERARSAMEGVLADERP